MDYSNCSCCGMRVDQRDLVEMECCETLYHAACLDTQDSVYGIKTCPSCGNRFTTTKLDEIYRLSKRMMVCVICFEPTPFVKRVLECNHWHHMICLAESIMNPNGTPSCPTCRGVISEDSVHYLKDFYKLQKVQDHLDWHAARNGVVELINNPDIFDTDIAKYLLTVCGTNLTGEKGLDGWYDDLCKSSECCLAHTDRQIEKWPPEKLARFLNDNIDHSNNLKKNYWNVESALENLYRDTHEHSSECWRNPQVCWLPPTIQNE